MTIIQPLAARTRVADTAPLPGFEDLAPQARPRLRRDVVTVVVDLAAAACASVVLLGSGPTVVPPLVRDVLLAVVWVLLLSGARCYAPGPLRGGSGGLRRVLRAGAGLVAVLAIGPALVPGLLPAQPEPSRLLALATVTCGVAVVQRHRPAGGSRGGRRATRGLTRAVVAGHGRDVARVVADLEADHRLGLHVSAVCVPPRSGTAFDVPVVRGFDLLADAAVAQGADVVIVLPCHHFDPVTLRRLGWQLEGEGVDLVVASGIVDVDRSRALTVRAGGLHLVHVRHAELTGSRRLVKQLWERPAAALALLLLSPVLAVVCLAIRLDSPGPALFRQVRIGKDSEPFVMHKLRTMTTDAEDRLTTLSGNSDADRVLFKMRQDPRVTRLGRLLRRYSIDELPQLLNVVRGEMSLVGPRPPLASEVLDYDGDTLRRLAVRPGMTGLWQVSGRSDLPWDQTVRLDLSYVDNWSLGLDALIIVRTLRAVVGHRGAY
jgi:exopolysaccharide biosynthesis polyprenyl glycosylphosphotransferase